MCMFNFDKDNIGHIMMLSLKEVYRICDAKYFEVEANCVSLPNINTFGNRKMDFRHIRALQNRKI